MTAIDALALIVVGLTFGAFFVFALLITWQAAKTFYRPAQPARRNLPAEPKAMILQITEIDIAVDLFIVEERQHSVLLPGNRLAVERTTIRRRIQN